ncbi:hypothetical protein ACFLZV_05440, partial [Candidatus Margulisiibacteriota bacterium]
IMNEMFNVQKKGSLSVKNLDSLIRDKIEKHQSFVENIEEKYESDSKQLDKEWFVPGNEELELECLKQSDKIFKKETEAFNSFDFEEFENFEEVLSHHEMRPTHQPCFQSSVYEEMEENDEYLHWFREGFDWDDSLFDLDFDPDYDDIYPSVENEYCKFLDESNNDLDEDLKVSKDLRKRCFPKDLSPNIPEKCLSKLKDGKFEEVLKYWDSQSDLQTINSGYDSRDMKNFYESKLEISSVCKTEHNKQLQVLKHDKEDQLSFMSGLRNILDNYGPTHLKYMLLNVVDETINNKKEFNKAVLIPGLKHFILNRQNLQNPIYLFKYFSGLLCENKHPEIAGKAKLGLTFLSFLKPGLLKYAFAFGVGWDFYESTGLKDKYDNLLGKKVDHVIPGVTILGLSMYFSDAFNTATGGMYVLGGSVALKTIKNVGDKVGLGNEIAFTSLVLAMNYLGFLSGYPALFILGGGIVYKIYKNQGKRTGPFQQKHNQLITELKNEINKMGPEQKSNMIQALRNYINQLKEKHGRTEKIDIKKIIANLKSKEDKEIIRRVHNLYDRFFANKFRILDKKYIEDLEICLNRLTIRNDVVQVGGQMLNNFTKNDNLIGDVVLGTVVLFAPQYVPVAATVWVGSKVLPPVYSYAKKALSSVKDSIYNYFDW